MTREAFDAIRLASVISTLIPLVCLFIYRKKQPKQYLILGISLLISFIFDVIGWSLVAWFDPRSTSFSNNLYFIIAFPAIMWFYHETLIKKTLKILVRVFTVVFLVLALIFTLQQGLSVINYNILTLSSVLITLTSMFFVADLNQMDQANFAKNPFHETNILLNTSLALYYFITIIMFAVSEYIFSHTTVEDARNFWAFHNTTHMLKNIGIAVAFYLTAKRSHTSIDLQKSKSFSSTIKR